MELAWKLAEAVQAQTGIHAADLMGRGRTEDLATVRHCCMFLVRSTGATWQATADSFNRGHHATAIHGHKKVQAMLHCERHDADQPCRRFLKQLAEAVEMRVPPECAD